MWTTKEVLVISLAMGLAACFATIYSQRKIQQYIDHRVTEKSANPLSSLLANEPSPLGNASREATASQPQPRPQDRVAVAETPPPPVEKQRLHEGPPGCGERWTPLPVAT